MSEKPDQMLRQSRSPQKAQSLQEQGGPARLKDSAMEDLCKHMKDLTMHLADRRPANRESRPADRRVERNDRPPLTCYKCGNPGHKAADCPSIAAAAPRANFARLNLFQRQEEPEEDLPFYDGSAHVLNTYFPRVYANESRNAPMQRTSAKQDRFHA